MSDAKRLRELEAENGRLKRLLAEAMLENEVTKVRKSRLLHEELPSWKILLLGPLLYRGDYPTKYSAN